MTVPSSQSSSQSSTSPLSDPLLQPYTLGGLTLRNRIMTTSHEPAYPEDGMPKDRYRAYHVERAKAGVALTMTAGSAAVSRNSPPVFNNVLAWRDDVVGWMRKLADECHDHGCAVMIQLTHLGRRTAWNKADWLPVVAPGPAREPSHRAFPKVLEDHEIAGIIEDYADAAARMHAAGLDGIEFECYGHLMDQFISPLTNRLSGPYGAQTLDSRAKFALDVLTACRAATSPDFLIGLRYCADEHSPGGTTVDEGIALGHMFKAAGADFLNVIRGQIHTDAALTDVIPVQGMKSAPHLDFAGRVRAEVGLPTFHASRIPDVATARHAIATGRLDMVGMTRAHMADPHIVRKIVEGREHDIRPCVGATYCLDRIYQAGDALCIHNAATGRELTMPHDILPAATPRRVVVVGAGPGGLEAARVAAARGHEVTVFEAQPHPGGQIRLTVLNKRRAEMIGIIDWRMAQCAARDVTFHFNTLAEADDITSLAPDVVVIATGGLPNTDIVAGADLVVSAWDIIAGDVKPGRDVLLYDDAGDHAAMQAAETLTDAGASVEIMSPDRTLAIDVMAMNLVPYMRTLQGRDVTFNPAWRLHAVTRDGNRLAATIGTDYSGLTRQKTYDQIVVNHGTLPLDDLYFALKPASANHGVLDQQALIDGRPQPDHGPGFALYRIGDAVASRNTHAAIYDALRLMKDI